MSLKKRGQRLTRLERGSVWAALRANPEESDRRLAEECGVTHPTVALWRRRLERFDPSFPKVRRRGRGMPQEIGGG